MRYHTGFLHVLFKAVSGNKSYKIGFSYVVNSLKLQYFFLQAFCIGWGNSKSTVIKFNFTDVDATICPVYY